MKSTQDLTEAVWSLKREGTNQSTLIQKDWICQSCFRRETDNISHSVLSYIGVSPLIQAGSLCLLRASLTHPDVVCGGTALAAFPGKMLLPLWVVILLPRCVFLIFTFYIWLVATCLEPWVNTKDPWLPQLLFSKTSREGTHVQNHPGAGEVDFALPALPQQCALSPPHKSCCLWVSCNGNLQFWALCPGSHQFLDKWPCLRRGPLLYVRAKLMS